MSGSSPQDDDAHVTLQDLRAARYCHSGARLFCRQHGLDWASFLAAGVPVESLRATGDALVEPVIAAAIARAAGERAGLPQTASTLTMATASTSLPPSGPAPDGQ